MCTDDPHLDTVQIRRCLTCPFRSPNGPQNIPNLGTVQVPYLSLTCPPAHPPTH